ncbi:MAG: hypothetical protein IM333_12995 [Microcystis sp. M048S1]|nr:MULTISPECIES: hypothetical protein [unclassified Microcystis]MCA2748403.1 hypothetical protein [Microcystis sp. M155S2]MCA2893793.1 hypothetical protein [Microcystis sp. M048S1]MCA2722988.1 hypothetical protein [Microcystis sp. M176S2]MCA2725507.1 hypothetical protein [Microcystis sp. M166S2]MCA2731561.1 hypothetical protein [Microcystis sp. M162S2]
MSSYWVQIGETFHKSKAFSKSNHCPKLWPQVSPLNPLAVANFDNIIG